MIRVTRNDSKTWVVDLVEHDMTVVNGVGRIVLKDGMFQYIPKGQRVGGEKFPTLTACIKSLED